MKNKLLLIKMAVILTIGILFLPNTIRAQVVQGEMIFDSLDFKIIRVWGDHQERGYAYGYLAGDQIDQMLSNYVKPIFGSNYQAARDLIESGSNFQIDPVYQTEAEAIIAGMNANNTNIHNLDDVDVMVGNCMLDLMGMMGMKSGLGCSSLLSWGDATTGTELEGSAIISRHLDWYSNSTLLSNHLIIVHQPTEPDEQNWMMVGFAGMTGALSGINGTLGVFQHMMSDYTGSSLQNQNYKPIWFATRDAVEKTDFNQDGACNVLDVISSLDESVNGFAEGYLISALAGGQENSNLTALIAEIAPTAPTHVYRDNSYPDSIPGDNLYTANFQIARNNMMNMGTRYNNVRNHIGSGTLYGIEENWNLLRDWSHQSTSVQFMQYAPEMNHFRMAVRANLPAYQSEYIDFDLSDLLNTVVGIESHIDQDQLEVYPNPAWDNITISGLPISGRATTIELINNLGSLVKRIPVSGATRSVILSLKDLESGIYYLKISGSNSVRQVKVVKD